MRKSDKKRRSLVVSGNALLCRLLINKEMLALGRVVREKLKNSDQKIIPRKESEERSSLWKRGRKVSDL